MENTRFKQLGIFMVIMIFLTAVTFIVWPIISIIILALGLIIFVTGFFEIPNNPETIGITTFFGKRNFNQTLNEGWQWLFLKGIIFDYILLRTNSRERKIICNQIITPDKLDLTAKIGISYLVDLSLSENYLKKDSTPKNTSNKEINHEAIDEEIQKSLESMIGDVLRQWAMHPQYGPHTWEEAVSSSLVAINNIAKSLFGSNLTGINSIIPTSVLIQYFSGDKPVNNYTRNEYGDGGDHIKDSWYKLKEMLDTYHNERDPNVENRESSLKNRILERIKILRDLQSSNAELKISSLGIIISRLNIEEMLPNVENEVYKASLKKETEKRDKESETIELETEIELAETLQKKRPDLSFKECLDYIKDYKLIKEGKGNIYKIPAEVVNLLKLFIK